MVIEILINLPCSLLTPKIVPELYEARAIVLGNMREHRQALLIYVFKLKDPEKAEKYVSSCEYIEPSKLTIST